MDDSNTVESAIKTMVTTFLKSGGGKDLSSKAFQKLVKKQFGGILEGTNSSDRIKEMQQGLDNDNDGKVSFEEYLNLIGYVASSLSESKAGSSASAS